MSPPLYQTIFLQMTKKQKLKQVQATTPPNSPDLKGRKEFLSPTPQVPQTVGSAIELTVKDFDPSEQRILDKCGEVDFQLSNN